MDIAALKKEARSKQTSVARLLELAKIDVQLSREIAKSKNAPVQVLGELAKSGDMPTRAAVAKNPNTPSATIDLLAHDKQWTVLKAAAQHPNISPQSLRFLASHNQASVRQAVADAMSYHNRLLPLDVVQRLALDRDRKVAHQIFRYNLYLVSKGPAPISDSTLDKMVSDPDPEWRAFYAHKSSYLFFNRSQLEKLVEDADPRVRASVGSYGFHAPGLNRNDLDLLIRLCQDTEKTVREAAYRNADIHLVKVPRKSQQQI